MNFCKNQQWQKKSLCNSNKQIDNQPKAMHLHWEKKVRSLYQVTICCNLQLPKILYKKAMYSELMEITSYLAASSIPIQLIMLSHKLLRPFVQQVHTIKSHIILQFDRLSKLWAMSWAIVYQIIWQQVEEDSSTQMQQDNLACLSIINFTHVNRAESSYLAKR